MLIEFFIKHHIISCLYDDDDDDEFGLDCRTYLRAFCISSSENLLPNIFTSEAKKEMNLEGRKIDLYMVDKKNVVGTLYHCTSQICTEDVKEKAVIIQSYPPLIEIEYKNQEEFDIIMKLMQELTVIYVPKEDSFHSSDIDITNPKDDSDYLENDDEKRFRLILPIEKSKIPYANEIKLQPLIDN
jgi:hypothetical protein